MARKAAMEPVTDEAVVPTEETEEVDAVVAGELITELDDPTAPESTEREPDPAAEDFTNRTLSYEDRLTEVGLILRGIDMSQKEATDGLDQQIQELMARKDTLIEGFADLRKKYSAEYNALLDFVNKAKSEKE